MIMKITVFGASGGIGQQVVTLAGQRGHDIRAVYRTAPDSPPDGPVEVLVNPDILDPGFVAHAIADADVVITAVGPNFAKRHNPRSRLLSPVDLHQRLARALVTATRGSGASSRLISVSTGSMGPADAVMGLAPRLLFRFFRTVVVRNLGVVGKDLLAMERELATSGLDWYAVRPIKLTNGPRTEHIDASDRFTMKTISRPDVAWYLLDLAEQPTPAHRTPIITSGQRQPGATEAQRTADRIEKS
jgi:nucleoside-diphosphate-sugar epimerase